MIFLSITMVYRWYQKIIPKSLKAFSMANTDQLHKKPMFSHEKLPSIQSQLANLDELPMLQMSIRLGPRRLGDHYLDRQPLADGTARGDVIRVAVGVEHKPQGEAQVLRFNHGKNGEKPWNTSEDLRRLEIGNGRCCSSFCWFLDKLKKNETGRFGSGKTMCINNASAATTQFRCAGGKKKWENFSSLVW